MKKGILTTALALGLVSGSASAYDVAGLDLELGTFNMDASFVQGLVLSDTAVADIDGNYQVTDYELEGYGLVQAIDGDSDYMCTGDVSCQLTYVFGGLSVSSIEPAVHFLTGDVLGIQINFDASESFLDFYLQEGTSQEIKDATTEFYSDTNADLFDNGDQYLDTFNVGNFTGFQLITGVSWGSGNLEVADQTIGAGWYFDVEGGTDIEFSSTINRTAFSEDSIQIAGDPIFVSAKGAQSFTTQVPEPSTLAMFSVALLGFGAAARRRSKKA